MKKILILAIFSLILTGCLPIKKTDETKTQAEPENIRQTAPTASPNNDDLTVPELEDFDQEVQNLDKSINQL